MRQPLPTEPELRAAARRLGLTYNPNDGTTRAKLIKAVQLADAEIADQDRADERETTVEQLARFHREVIEYGAAPVEQELADRLLVAVAGALVRRDGLVLKPRNTNEENRES